MATYWDEIFNKPQFRDAYTEIANTTLDNLQFLTVDTSKMGEDGRTITINKYTSTGNPFRFLNSEDDTTEAFEEIGYETVSYTVKEILGQSHFTSLAQLDMNQIDRIHKDNLVKYVKEFVTTETVNAWYGISNFITLDPSQDRPFFYALTQVAVELNHEQGEDNLLVAYVNPKTYAAIQNEAVNDFKFVEKFAGQPNVFVYGGFIIKKMKVVSYTDLNTNTTITTQIEDNNIVLAPRSAVTYFKKKDFRTKDTESADMGSTIIAMRGAGVIALTDDTNACIIAPSVQTVDPSKTISITASTVSAAKAAGVAPTGVEVDVYIDGKLKESVVAESDAWETEDTYTGAVTIIAKKRGYTPVSK